MNFGSFLMFTVARIERLISPSFVLFRAKSPGCQSVRSLFGLQGQKVHWLFYIPPSLKVKVKFTPRTGHEGPEGE